jgi:hypothetical protein
MAINADTAGAPSEAQWQALMSATKDKPVAQAILTAADNSTGAAQRYVTARKRSLGTELRRWTMAGFEITNGEIAGVAAVVNAQAALRGLSGVTPLAARFIAVLEAELQEAAEDLGYGAQAALLTIPWYTYGTREDAITAAQAYLAANTVIWHE